MRLMSCVLILIFSLQLSARSDPPADFSLTLERSGCEGFCPWYIVTILSNGSVHYEGKAYVLVEGIREKKISVTVVHKLIERLQVEGFFHWDEKSVLCVDYPDVKISTTLSGRHKQVVEGCSSPGNVLSLADQIDTVAGTKSWVGNVGEEMMQQLKEPSAKETLARKCHIPKASSGNQPMPDELKIPKAVKTARDVSCFTSFKKDTTMLDVVEKCGVPDQHAGSGIYIFGYYMDDCSMVSVGTPDLKKLTIRHVKQKRTTVLFRNW